MYIHHSTITVDCNKRLSLKGPFISEGSNTTVWTSDSGPSEIETQYNKPLYKGRFSRSQIIGLPMVLISPRRGQPLYKGSTKDLNLYCSQSVLCSEVRLYFNTSLVPRPTREMRSACGPGYEATSVLLLDLGGGGPKYLVHLLRREVPFMACSTWIYSCRHFMWSSHCFSVCLLNFSHLSNELFIQHICSVWGICNGWGAGDRYLKQDLVPPA